MTDDPLDIDIPAQTAEEKGYTSAMIRMEHTFMEISQQRKSNQHTFDELMRVRTKPANQLTFAEHIFRHQTREIIDIDELKGQVAGVDRAMAEMAAFIQEKIS